MWDFTNIHETGTKSTRLKITVCASYKVFSYVAFDTTTLVEVENGMAAAEPLGNAVNVIVMNSHKNIERVC